MLPERTTGLILRTRPLTETSLIVHWLTRDFGRLATVAKGARRAKSPFAGKLDLFYLADFTFHQSRRSELHTLREVSVRDFHEPLRHELGHLQQASYFTQLLELTTEVNTPLPAMFELLLHTLEALPKRPPSPLFVHAFEMKLLDELGLRPDFAESNLSLGAREILDRLPSEDWDTLSRIKPSREQSHELERFLHHFLLFHLGRVPKARPRALP